MTPRPVPASSAPAVDRRTFLRYVGTGAAALAAGPELGPLAHLWAQAAPPGAAPWVLDHGRAGWTSPPYPVPLPGDPGPLSADAARLARFEVVDDLVVPAGFRWDVIAQWGEVFGPPGDPARQIRFGYNCDYTGLVPIAGSADEFYLMVNHEYVSSRPWLQACRGVLGVTVPEVRLEPGPDGRGARLVIGDLPGEGLEIDPAQAAPAQRAELERLARLALGEMGVSILRVRRDAAGRIQVVRDAPDHRRISTIEVHNLAPGAQPFRYSGPAAFHFSSPPLGTMCNCSGGTTPWGTFLTCEENFQNQTHEEVTPAGTVLPRTGKMTAEGLFVRNRLDTSVPEPVDLDGYGFVLPTTLDGRGYGWVCEIDPATGQLAKHTHLGRFRHENVAVRAVAGRRLAAYQGDDRRGGHVWKFVSREAVRDPRDPANRRLFEDGTLYVARFSPDFTGRWIPLVPETPLALPDPDRYPSGHLLLPQRPAGGFVAVGDRRRRITKQTPAEWRAAVEAFTGKPFAETTLGDLVTGSSREQRLGVLVMDAFVMANAAGGTPTARPEDLEIHPGDGSVYIAFTDATGSRDGSPDGRVFPDSRGRNSRQYGAVYRLVEDFDDPASTTFTWGKFVSSGEVAEQGGGFANADNLVFDPQGNLWMVTDISTTAQNVPTNRFQGDQTQRGGRYFPGIFGNNAMFLIPAVGPRAGKPSCFATGPVDCELTGPTFTADGRTLVLSVQHPGEIGGTRSAQRPPRLQTHVIHDREDHAFQQKRVVPRGSNFPHGQIEVPPRPTVVCITKK